MKPSFGGSSGAGGGGMFRTASRVARAGVSNIQDHAASSSTNSPRKASSMSALSLSTPLNPTTVAISNSIYGFGPSWPLLPSSVDDSEWVDVDGELSDEDDDDDDAFGSVPSASVAQTVLISVQQALPVSSGSSDSDWMEPSLHPYGYERRISPRIATVYDALHLLQTDPSIQRAVISLSSDRAVWDAVMQNEAVQELRKSYFKASAAISSENSSDNNDLSKSSTNVLSWILDRMRSKFLEFLGSITDLMKDVFQPSDTDHEIEEIPDEVLEKVKVAFMLTAIVMLVVALTRAHGA